MARWYHSQPLFIERPTPREKQLLLLAAQGYSNPRIGKALHLSTKYVRNCFTARILPKYGARNRTQAVIRAMMLGDISPPSRD